METPKQGRKKSKFTAFLDPGPTTSGGRQRRKDGGGSEPDLRKHRSHSTGSGGEKERKREDNRCHCCRKHYSIMDSLKRVNPPKFCYYCREEVCKRCHSNDSCHRCFTRERSDIRSISRLEEMDRKELEKIMRDLHCPKDLFDQEEPAELILAILKYCNMNVHFVQEFREHLHRKTHPETLNRKVDEENLERKLDKENCDSLKGADTKQLDENKPEAVPCARRSTRSLDHFPLKSEDMSSSSSLSADFLSAPPDPDFRSVFLQQLQSATDEQLRALSAVFSLMNHC